MATIVTSFMQLPESREKNIENYFEHFKRLENTGLNIHLFLQAHVSETYSPPPNVNVEILEFEDLKIYKDLQNINYSLPENRNYSKDTANYLIMQNSKVEFVYRAIQNNIYNSETFMWVDFGIGHVIKNDSTFDNLKNIESINGLYIPGCYGSHNISLNKICWRFCGGVFIGDKKSIIEFYDLYENHFIDIVKDNVLTWEVNIWSIFEKLYNFIPIWYRADHNDSILMFPHN